VVSDISVTSLCLLDNDLSIEDDPEACDEKRAHHVTKAKHRTASHEPTYDSVHEHHLQHCHDNSTQEQERSSL